MRRLVLDIQGGDHAPSAMLGGAQEALPELGELDGELLLVGDETLIRTKLKERRFRALARAVADGQSDSVLKNGLTVRIVHAPDTIGMEDSIRAIRSKPAATINVGCRLAAEGYAASPRVPTAFVSAGHSGAMMASALIHMGRLKGAERPAIAVKLPTLSEDGCVLLDVGANVDCKPEHLRDFAVMGAFFAQVERKGPGLPRVGVLSNGEERTKGNDLSRAAHDLIEKLPAFQPGPHAVGQFVGNVEGKEIFKGHVDVVVADGFVGNAVLKSVESVASALFSFLKQESRRGVFNRLGFLLSAASFRRIKRRTDYAETGAAPLLGVAGYAFICHGRSNSRAIKNALLRAQTALKGQFVERLEVALASTVAEKNAI